jgi:hypothetical protein
MGQRRTLMTDQIADRPLTRTIRKPGSRFLGFRKELTPEELAARHAAETAKKIKAIFGEKTK